MSARLAGIFLDSSSEQTTRFKNTSVPKDLLYMEWTSFPGNHKKNPPWCTSFLFPWKAQAPTVKSRSLIIFFVV